MDRPQTQIFQSNQNSYRFMKYPMQKQKLQLLYPGRFMNSDYHYNGDNILNKYPEGAISTKMKIAELARIASRDEEAISRHLGGKSPIYDHTSIEPEQPVEDIADFTSAIQVGTRGQSDVDRDVEIVKSNLPSLTTLHQDDVIEVNDITKQYPHNTILQKPNRYSWKEGFEYDNNSQENSYLPHLCLGIMTVLVFWGLMMLLATKK